MLRSGKKAISGSRGTVALKTTAGEAMYHRVMQTTCETTYS